ncbi:MAG: hypothetical protein M1469_10255 [Bacteroidetes bacterium]|nr:hypothetical protein [Bacteroidota bacterium]
MKACLVFLVMATTDLTTTIPAYAQELLTTTLSAEGTGMGGMDASVISNNAMATTANPAQLGIFSLTNLFSASTYTPRTIWAPGSSTQVYPLESSAVNAGISIKRFMNAPFDFSAGFGYSKTTLGLGKYSGFQDNGDYFSSPMGEELETRSVAIGIDWLVKAAIGYNFKNTDIQQPIVASNGFLIPSDIVGHVHDIGVIVQVPVVDSDSRVAGQPIMLTRKVRPIFDITLSYARRNIGGSTTSWIFQDTIPFPRQAIIGLNFKIGLETHVQYRKWTFFSFMWGRQADDILFTYNPEIEPFLSPSYSHYVYKKGIGDLRPIDNLILGRSYGDVNLHSGWHVQVGEFLYVSSGKSYAIGYGTYSTLGAGFRLEGILKLLTAYHLIDIERGGVYSFLIDHLDLQYDCGEYIGTSNTDIAGTNFRTLNVVIR